jgi:ATP-dependent RNA helicase HelY
MSPTGAHPAPVLVLDRFQVEAIAAVDAGRNVLVAAPTGAGKTVVAEHAVDRTLAEGGRAFYTTPIKALSNQKYRDLAERHGSARVGLLTGDTAVNPGAPVVVMTTEVLRNMVYARASALDGLRWVVLDEVHYLQDAYRGPVWEEVIIHTPAPVRFVCLSATVSNAEELAGWLTATRGPTDTVIEHERPVELLHEYLVEGRSTGELIRIPTLLGGRPNPEGSRFDAPAPTGDRWERGRQQRRRRWATPRRVDVVDHLAAAGLLPAIYFLFSRAGCDEAARSVVDAGARLTTAPERERIRELAERAVDHLGRSDLRALEFDRWLAGLESGVAAHHAGLVPPFKEAVETCFAEGLVKVVFATETLALGINMPARSVVVEALSKYTGDGHEDLTPSQFAQLTGRAGRRGLDPIGHAVVLWSPWHQFDKAAGLAASREFVLRSAFAPTYNMVVNLIDRYGRDHAHELLGRSFAQYQADRHLSRVEHRRARQTEALAEAEQGATCERGSVDEYRALRAEERRRAREARAATRREREAAIGALVPGDLVDLGGEVVAVLSASHRKGGVRLRVVGSSSTVTTLDGEELDRAPTVVGRVALPEPFDPGSRAYQHQVAALVRKAGRRAGGPVKPGRGTTVRGTGAGAAGEAAAAPSPEAGPRADDHPVAACPDLSQHLAAAGERDRLRERLGQLDRLIADRSTSLTRRFDVIADLLRRRGFLHEGGLTRRGRVLARVFHECDLLVATAVCDGLFDDLDPASLAAVASTLVYEHRSKDRPPPPWYPSPVVRDRCHRLEVLGTELVRDEGRAALPPTRLPDPTFVASAHAWAAGESLETLLEAEEHSGGDFVRTTKQLIDLLRQLGEVAPERSTAAAARAAAAALHRGIVAASSDVTPPDQDGDGSEPTVDGEGSVEVPT